MNKTLVTLTLGAAALFVASCEDDNGPDTNKNKDYQTCVGPTHVTNDGAETYTYKLDEKAPEFNDTLNKYATVLQAKKVTETGNNITLECNVWLRQNVQLFFAKYGLSKDLNTGNITAIHANNTQYDFANFNVSPSVRYESAYDEASKYFIYDNMCVKYTLGIFENAVMIDSSYYRLAWKFEGLKTGNIVYIDAENSNTLDTDIQVMVN